MNLPTYIKAYQQWLEDLHAKGWLLYYGTIHFNQLNHSTAIKLKLVQNEAERIYHLLLTNIIRNPMKKHQTDLPLLIGCPDRPVAKHKPTARFAEMVPNEAMHYQFALSVPPINRLRVPLEQHVREKMEIYLGRHGVVSRFDLRPFPRVKNQRIADYLFKHIKRGTYAIDDILILPAGRPRN
jgi:hypothetical protein